MRVSTSLIKSRDTDPIDGRMDVITKDTGGKENSMVSAPILMRAKGLPSLVFGNTQRDSSGSTRMQ